MGDVQLKIVSLDPKITDLLSYYYEVGGVIDFKFFEYSKESDFHANHRQAAIQGIHELINIPSSEKLASEPVGKEIDWKDFLGPTLDPKHPFFFGTSALSSSEYTTVGFVAAFRKPPYSMKVRADELYQLLMDVLREIFNDGKNVRVIEWSTDWSEYFEPGKDWWGAFCWTVLVEDRYILTVAASTTD